jgi:hypothetical protein
MLQDRRVEEGREPLEGAGEPKRSQGSPRFEWCGNPVRGDDDVVSAGPVEARRVNGD